MSAWACSAQHSIVTRAGGRTFESAPGDQDSGPDVRRAKVTRAEPAMQALQGTAIQCLACRRCGVLTPGSACLKRMPPLALNFVPHRCRSQATDTCQSTSHKLHQSIKPGTKKPSRGGSHDQLCSTIPGMTLSSQDTTNSHAHLLNRTRPCTLQVSIGCPATGPLNTPSAQRWEIGFLGRR